MIHPADNSFFEGLDLIMSLCTKSPLKIPRAHRPRARFPPQLPRLVIFSRSVTFAVISINAVPASPPTIAQNNNSMRFPPCRHFPDGLFSCGKGQHRVALERIFACHKQIVTAYQSSSHSSAWRALTSPETHPNRDSDS